MTPDWTPLASTLSASKPHEPTSGVGETNIVAAQIMFSSFLVYKKSQIFIKPINHVASYFFPVGQLLMRHIRITARPSLGVRPQREPVTSFAGQRGSQQHTDFWRHDSHSCACCYWDLWGPKLGNWNPFQLIEELHFCCKKTWLLDDFWTCCRHNVDEPIIRWIQIMSATDITCHLKQTKKDISMRKIHIGHMFGKALRQRNSKVRWWFQRNTPIECNIFRFSEEN